MRPRRFPRSDVSVAQLGRPSYDVTGTPKQPRLPIVNGWMARRRAPRTKRRAAVLPRNAEQDGFERRPTARRFAICQHESQRGEWLYTSSGITFVSLVLQAISGKRLVMSRDIIATQIH